MSAFKYLLISLFLFVLSVFGLLDFVRNGAHYVFTPIQFGFQQVALEIKESARFFYKIRLVRNENLVLLAQVENLQSTILDLKRFEEENKVLREQLVMTEKEEFNKKLLLANVMGNASDPTGTTVFLDKGTRHGVTVGCNVIRGAFLVGVVRKVYVERSLVELITSPNVSATVKDIDVAEKTEGLAVGQYGISIEVRRILPAERVRVGDTFVSSGKDGLFSPGFSFGKVVGIIENPSDPLKTAKLETVLDLSKLERVFIVLD